MGVREDGRGTPRAFYACGCYLVVPEEKFCNDPCFHKLYLGKYKQFQSYIFRKKGKKNQVCCNNLISTYLRRFPQREE